MAVAIAVWMVYVADRLLDAIRIGAEHELEARHFFHHRHGRAFLIGLAVAAVGLAALLPRLDPAAIRLYWIEGVLLLVWFSVLHASRSARRLPKEIAVGLFFATAIFRPPVAREPALRVSLLPAALLFAALCSLNCLFIYAWEHEGVSCSTMRLAHATTWVAVAHLPALAIAAVGGGFTIAVFGSPSGKPVGVAGAMAAGVLLGLHRYGRLLSRNDLRAAADVALLTPLLLLPIMR